MTMNQRLNILKEEKGIVEAIFVNENQLFDRREYYKSNYNAKIKGIRSQVHEIEVLKDNNGRIQIQYRKLPTDTWTIIKDAQRYNILMRANTMRNQLLPLVNISQIKIDKWRKYIQYIPVQEKQKYEDEIKEILTMVQVAKENNRISNKSTFHNENIINVENINIDEILNENRVQQAVNVSFEQNPLVLNSCIWVPCTSWENNQLNFSNLFSFSEFTESQ